MNSQEGINPLQPTTNLLINRRTLKLSSAANRVKDPSSHRSRIGVQNILHNYRSHDTSIPKEDLMKEKGIVQIRPKEF